MEIVKRITLDSCSLSDRPDERKTARGKKKNMNMNTGGDSDGSISLRLKLKQKLMVYFHFLDMNRNVKAPMLTICMGEFCTFIVLMHWLNCVGNFLYLEQVNLFIICIYGIYVVTTGCLFQLFSNSLLFFLFFWCVHSLSALNETTKVCLRYFS